MMVTITSNFSFHCSFRCKCSCLSSYHKNSFPIKFTEDYLSVACSYTFLFPSTRSFSLFLPIPVCFIISPKKMFVQTDTRAHTHRDKREGNKERFFYLDNYNFLTVTSLTKFQYDTLYLSQNKYFSKLGQTFVYIYSVKKSR